MSCSTLHITRAEYSSIQKDYGLLATAVSNTVSTSHCFRKEIEVSMKKFLLSMVALVFGVFCLVACESQPQSVTVDGKVLQMKLFDFESSAANSGVSYKVMEMKLSSEGYRPAKSDELSSYVAGCETPEDMTIVALGSCFNSWGFTKCPAMGGQGQERHEFGLEYLQNLSTRYSRILGVRK